MSKVLRNIQDHELLKSEKKAATDLFKANIEEIFNHLKMLQKASNLILCLGTNTTDYFCFTETYQKENNAPAGEIHIKKNMSSFFVDNPESGIDVDAKITEFETFVKGELESQISKLQEKLEKLQ